MVGGRLRCLSCFFTCSSVLLLGLCLHDVEASRCQRVIHKKVGDTVEMSSCLPTEGVTDATWKYGGSRIAVKDKPVSAKQFTGRIDLNPTNFSLTVRGLTLQDSGNFSFVSEANDTQRKTVFITLQVHESITTPPVLTVNSTWHPLNESCTVSLECSATTDSSVAYNWTVGNKTSSGSRLQHMLRAQDGETTFTCTIYNFVNEMSASKPVKCSKEPERSPENYIILLSVTGGICLMTVIILAIGVGVCCCKKSQPVVDQNDLTVYADITEVATEDVTMKPCSVYETIDNRVNVVKPGPQTVYDKIQLNRVRNDLVSPYQDVS